MGLIERQFNQVASYDVDPSSATIKEGMLVAMNGTAGVRRVTSGDGGKVVGIAGDSTVTPGMPGVSGLWANRQSDLGNETRASGKISVYYAGGEFYTDQFVSDSDMVVGNVGKYLKADESTGKLIYDGAAVTANTVAQLLAAPAQIESGVPGTDINGSMALGGDNNNTYILVKLMK